MEGRLDCAACAVPAYGSTERFCAKCRRHLLQKNYCVTLREAGASLLPFIVLDDAAKAIEYAARLGRQGVPHILLSWDGKQRCFSDF